MSNQYFDCPFGLKGIRIPSYKELKSPPKPEGIQITVCASTWNREKEIIVGSIKSIFDQKFPMENYEVILVDDATEGERVQDLKEAISELVRDYPDHNFRVYITVYTRCYNDPHTLNVAFKRALGEILMISQVDILHIGETLESAWRHHSNLDKLWLCPKHYGEKSVGTGMEDAVPWLDSYFPHEFGASVRKKYVHQIKGRNEKILSEPPDVDFHIRLGRLGIVFGEDESVKTLHRSLAHAGCDRLKRKVPKNFPPPQGDWGALTPEEEKKVIMTEPMRKLL